MKLSDFVQNVIEASKNLDRTRYFPDASTWHEPQEDGYCHACLAGAYAATEFGIPHYKQIFGWTTTGNEIVEMEESQVTTMRALDDIRLGQWDVAQIRLQPDRMIAPKDLKTLPGKPIFSSFFGWEQFEAFLQELTQVVQKLRALGY